MVFIHDSLDGIRTPNFLRRANPRDEDGKHYLDWEFVDRFHLNLVDGASWPSTMLIVADGKRIAQSPLLQAIVSSLCQTNEGPAVVVVCGLHSKWNPSAFLQACQHGDVHRYNPWSENSVTMKTVQVGHRGFAFSACTQILAFRKKTQTGKILVFLPSERNWSSILCFLRSTTGITEVVDLERLLPQSVLSRRGVETTSADNPSTCVIVDPSTPLLCWIATEDIVLVITASYEGKGSLHRRMANSRGKFSTEARSYCIPMSYMDGHTIHYGVWVHM